MWRQVGSVEAMYGLARTSVPTQFPDSVECTGLLSCLNPLPTTCFHALMYPSYGALAIAIILYISPRQSSDCP